MSRVQIRGETTRAGGVTGKGFEPGVSGNPGGRPRGLGRRVRELVGDDGHEIAELMFCVMHDERARTVDRIEAAKWLADRGFGKAALVVEAGATEHVLREFISGLSSEDFRGDDGDPRKVFIGRDRGRAPRASVTSRQVVCEVERVILA
jgi:hypothetical protein